MIDCRLFVYQLVGDGGKAGEDVKVGGKPGLDGDDVATHEGHGVDIGSKLEGKEVRNHIMCCFPRAIIQILTCFATSNTSTLLFKGDGRSREGRLWWWWQT